MDADEIKQRCEELMGRSPGGRVVRVSSIGEYFIPDSATGTKADMQAGTREHAEREEEMDDIAWDELRYCVLKLPRSIETADADRFDDRLFGAAKDGSLERAADAVEDDLGNGTAFTKRFTLEDHKEDVEEALAHQ